ncbi:dehydrin COR410-like [Bidens hawaiensis]|uniref:dehydrin COR410-like n=1 Tax=Bidens hawaiensis TaxID=980011 RepID=UPI00404A2933
MSNEAVYHDAPKTEEPCETTKITDVKVEPETVEQSDRGLFDFIGKKKEEENKCEEAVISSEFEQKVQVTEPEPKAEEKKESLLAKLHRSDSSSSSSSDEEDENGEKKKKKKSLKDKVKEKIEDHKEEKEEAKIEKLETDTCVPVEKYEEVAAPAPTPAPEEKKGFIEKIKEKLPGGHKKEEEHVAAPPPPPPAAVEHDDKEKKGIFEKIKEKIPGYHSKSEEEKEKGKVKECD